MLFSRAELWQLRQYQWKFPDKRGSSDKTAVFRLNRSCEMRMNLVSDPVYGRMDVSVFF